MGHESNGRGGGTGGTVARTAPPPEAPPPLQGQPQGHGPSASDFAVGLALRAAEGATAAVACLWAAGYAGWPALAILPLLLLMLGWGYWAQASRTRPPGKA